MSAILTPIIYKAVAIIWIINNPPSEKRESKLHIYYQKGQLLVIWINLPSEKREIFTPEWQLIWINLPPEKRESKLHIILPDRSFWLESVSILNCVTRCWEHTTSVPIVLPGSRLATLQLEKIRSYQKVGRSGSGM
jgi:hypothetical protein